MWIRPKLVSDMEAIKQLEKDIFGDAWSENNIKDSIESKFDYCVVIEEDYRVLAYLRDMKVKKVFLEVRCQNKDAIRLYEDYGFKKLGVRKEYYNNPTDDALLMEGYIKC